MYTIYVDTSKRNEKIIELRQHNKEGTVVVETLTGDFDSATEISTLLKKHKIQPHDIEEFIPFLGPGSFTGLKNGVTLCNVLNWALGKKKVEELPLPNYGSEPNIQSPSK